MMEIRTIKVRVRFIAEPDDGGFHVYCPELKGLHVGGATEDEAFENARHAAEAYLMSLIRHNDPLPVGSQDTKVDLGELLLKAASKAFGISQSHSRIEELSIAA